MRSESRIFDILICPVCGERLAASVDGKSFICAGGRRHCFDLASSGYVNLALVGSGGGDSKDAVRARRDFLSLEKYSPVADAVVELLDEHVGGGTVIDAGCGEGYYARRVAESGYGVLGFDISKEAVNMAAKAARRAQDDAFFGVASVFSLPVADESADALINIFAPCVEREYSRVLKRGGILLVAYAGRDHLLGLKRALYDSVYTNEARADMPQDLELLGERRVAFDMSLESERDIQNLFEMTPYYWRTSSADKQKLAGRTRLESEVDIIIAAYRKN